MRAEIESKVEALQKEYDEARKQYRAAIEKSNKAQANVREACTKAGAAGELLRKWRGTLAALPEDSEA